MSCLGKPANAFFIHQQMPANSINTSSPVPVPDPGRASHDILMTWGRFMLAILASLTKLYQVFGINLPNLRAKRWFLTKVLNNSSQKRKIINREHHQGSLVSSSSIPDMKTSKGSTST